MTLTVVRPDDLADRLLDREKHPQWQGERTKMVYAFPENEALWAEYAEIWREGMRADRASPRRRSSTATIARRWTPAPSSPGPSGIIPTSSPPSSTR
jgi:hypothetical protein